MHLENRIIMRGDPDRIFQLAAAIEEWPQILPHYRYVILEERADRHKIARMGASRDGIPVRWQARQELIPEERRILFTHIGGVTKGMNVEWRLIPGLDGVEVTIGHDLSYPVPLLGPIFARYVVGGFFIHNIAGKTLRCIQQIVESESSLPASGQ